MALVESILTGETKKVTSDEMLRYCDFAPFVLPEELRSRIESSLPTQISIVREKQIEETAERIKQLERQLEDVHLIIDSDEEKIEDVGQLIANLDVSLQKLKVDTESDFERLKKASASYRESLDLIEARVSASESDFRKLKSVSDGTALAANEAFSGLQDVHTAISEMASHLTAFKNELDSLKSKTDDLHLHTQSVGHQSAGPDIHYKVVEPPEGVTRIDDLGLLATSFISELKDSGIRTAWSELLLLLTLTAFRSGAILLISGSIRRIIASSIATLASSRITELTMPVGAISDIDSHAGKSNHDEVEAHVVHSINLAQFEIALPNIYRTSQQRLLSKHPSLGKTVHIATAGSGGLFVEPDIELIEVSLCIVLNCTQY